MLILIADFVILTIAECVSYIFGKLFAGSKGVKRIIRLISYFVGTALMANGYGFIAAAIYFAAVKILLPEFSVVKNVRKYLDQATLFLVNKSYKGINKTPIFVFAVAALAVAMEIMSIRELIVIAVIAVVVKFVGINNLRKTISSKLHSIRKEKSTVLPFETKEDNSQTPVNTETAVKTPDDGQVVDVEI